MAPFLWPHTVLYGTLETTLRLLCSEREYKWPLFSSCLLQMLHILSPCAFILTLLIQTWRREILFSPNADVWELELGSWKEMHLVHCLCWWPTPVFNILYFISFFYIELWVVGCELWPPDSRFLWFSPSLAPLHWPAGQKFHHDWTTDLPSLAQFVFHIIL